MQRLLLAAVATTASPHPRAWLHRSLVGHCRTQRPSVSRLAVGSGLLLLHSLVVRNSPRVRRRRSACCVGVVVHCVCERDSKIVQS